MYLHKCIKINKCSIFVISAMFVPLKTYTLIAAHDCASFSVRLLIALNMLIWVGRHPGSVFNVNTPII